MAQWHDMICLTKLKLGTAKTDLIWILCYLYKFFTTSHFNTAVDFGISAHTHSISMVTFQLKPSQPVASFIAGLQSSILILGILREHASNHHLKGFWSKSFIGWVSFLPLSQWCQRYTVMLHDWTFPHIRQHILNLRCYINLITAHKHSTRNSNDTC